MFYQSNKILGLCNEEGANKKLDTWSGMGVGGWGGGCYSGESMWWYTDWAIFWAGFGLKFKTSFYPIYSLISV
jgi:hypothetical protein